MDLRQTNTTSSPTVEEYKQKISELLETDEKDLVSKDRHGEKPLSRHVAIYLMRNLTKWRERRNKKPRFALYQLAFYFKRKNHASIVYSIDKVAGFMRIYPDFKEKIENLTEEFLKFDHEYEAENND